MTVADDWDYAWCAQCSMVFRKEGNDWYQISRMHKTESDMDRRQSALSNAASNGSQNKNENAHSSDGKSGRFAIQLSLTP